MWLFGLFYRIVAWLFHVMGYAIVAVLVVATAALLVLRSMPGSSFDAALPASTTQQQAAAKRLREHVVAIASVEHNAVNAYPELERSALYIEAQLKALGFEPRRQVFEVGGKPVRNIEVRVPALSNPSGAVFVVGAHYDSGLGSPGANDNGTGVAALLEIARALSTSPAASRNTDLVLVFYVNEEPPYFRTARMGSRVHAKALRAEGRPISGMWALETLGMYSDIKGSQHYPPFVKYFFPDTGNFVGFAGTTDSYSFVRRSVGAFRNSAAFPSQGLAAPRQIPGIDWSDHQGYAELGVPSLMVTDTAIYRYAQYHTADDTVDHVDFDKLARVTEGLTAALAQVTGPVKAP